MDWHWHIFETLSSTNSYCKENAASLPHGSIVIARSQTAGRGRRGKAWVDSPPDSALAMSILLKSEGDEALRGYAPVMPLVIGVAVARAVFALSGRACTIKWPNDVLLENKKLCGILCESLVCGDSFCLVGGFGVNLTQPRTFFDENGLPHATSIAAETGGLYTREQAADAIAAQLSSALATVQAEGFGPIRDEYAGLCINIGREVDVSVNGARMRALAVGIADNGNLICEAGGSRFTVNAGEASVRGVYGYV